ncbi:MAG: methylamine utilization protein MauJ [Terriglobales bacterium]
MCDENNVPELARLTIPELLSESIPDEILPLLQIVKEHLISVLRLIYKQELNFLPIAIWSFFDAGAPYSFGIHLDSFEKHEFNADNIRNAFVHTMGIREEIRLLVDGLDERIPIQFRYLSFYKILEKRYKTGSKWKKKEFFELLNRFQEEFNKAGLHGKPDAILHSFRDKCAHVRTGKKKQVRGVTQLGHKELVEICKVLPVLRLICRDVVNELAEGKIVLGSLEPWYERLEHKTS